MSIMQTLRVPEQDRWKLAWMLVPFAVILLAIGAVTAMNHLHEVRHRGPLWPIILAGVFTAHVASTGLAYLGWWHHVRETGRHSAVQGVAIRFSFLWLLLAIVAFVIVVGIDIH